MLHWNADIAYRRSRMLPALQYSVCLLIKKGTVQNLYLTDWPVQTTSGTFPLKQPVDVTNAADVLFSYIFSQLVKVQRSIFNISLKTFQQYRCVKGLSPVLVCVIVSSRHADPRLLGKTPTPGLFQSFYLFIFLKKEVRHRRSLQTEESFHFQKTKQKTASYFRNISPNVCSL